MRKGGENFGIESVQKGVRDLYGRQRVKGEKKFESSPTGLRGCEWCRCQSGRGGIEKLLLRR